MKAFISHNSKDKSIAQSIGQFLLDQGIDVWFDKWEINAGESLTDKIGVRRIFTPQSERWTTVFPSVVKSGDCFFTKQLFEIEECFNEDNPYWTYDVDSPTDKLMFSINCKNSTPIKDFKVFHRVGHTLYDEPVQPELIEPGRYVWEKLFPTYKDTYEFHWLWTE